LFLIKGCKKTNLLGFRNLTGLFFYSLYININSDQRHDEKCRKSIRKFRTNRYRCVILIYWRQERDFKKMMKKIWKEEIFPFTLYFKVLFMDTDNPSLETLQDIKRMMERSSRFISLSGLSGVSAGIFALVGAWVAHGWIAAYYTRYNGRGYATDDFHELKWKFVVLALIVLTAALASSFYFTWSKARRNKLPVWDHTSKKLLMNLAIPLIAGGLFVMGLLYHNDWRFLAPSCLIFYGLALVNASKYTLSDIRYIGMLEIALGAANMYYEEYSLYFWAVGFGLLHIVYGLIMWWKYDYKTTTT
jgi:hypothetical protein